MKITAVLRAHYYDAGGTKQNVPPSHNIKYYEDKHDLIYRVVVFQMRSVVNEDRDCGPELRLEEYGQELASSKEFKLKNYIMQDCYNISYNNSYVNFAGITFMWVDNMGIVATAEVYKV
jgi:hypothetical protein